MDRESDSSTITHEVELSWKTRLRHFLRRQVFWPSTADSDRDPVPIAVKWMSWQALARDQRWIHDLLRTRSDSSPRTIDSKNLQLLVSFFNEWPLCIEVLNHLYRVAA